MEHTQLAASAAAGNLLSFSMTADQAIGIGGVIVAILALFVAVFGIWDARREREKRDQKGCQSHPPSLTSTEPSERTRPWTVTPLSVFLTLTVSPTEPSCNAAPTVVIVSAPSM